VRIVKEKHKLEKGYTANFSNEVFEIIECLKRQPPVYRIKDSDGEAIVGIFYEAELTPALNEETFDIEKILKRRTRKGIKELFVKWKGYSSKYNQWLKETDLS
jgi:hypothetical protein